jgi:uncharacterized membrane protein
MSPILQSSPWVRYLAAVVVAFVASVAIEVVFVTIAVMTHMTSDSSPTLSAVFPACTNLLVGLVGVFAGSCCLARADRVLGSLVLVALGIGFEVLMLGQAHGEFHFPRGAIASGIGGLLVVAFYLWRKRQLPNDAA